MRRSRCGSAKIRAPSVLCPVPLEDVLGRCQDDDEGRPQFAHIRWHLCVRTGEFKSWKIFGIYM